MYDKLVKRLRMQADAERFFSGESMLYDEAADAIEELTAELEYTKRQYDFAVEDLEKIGWGKWIPVAERLPDRADLVLIWHHSNTGNHFYGLDVYDGVGWIISENVTHWMPLPEPPKGD